MGKLRRAVSSRANARLREVNAAANEAPTPEVARRVKTRLDPSDVLRFFSVLLASPNILELRRGALRNFRLVDRHVREVACVARTLSRDA